jgi:hypothetical protein
MTNHSFAYRPILQELTEAVNDQGLDPYEAYGWLHEQQAAAALQPETYLSSSITSGGHARDDSLNMREVIARNTESARLLADQLAIDRQINPKAAIEPVFVGKTHWNQAQFMEFWLNVIGGFQLTPQFIARDIDNLRTATHRSFEAGELDLGLMTSDAPPEARAQEYFKMARAFADLVTEGAEAEPISAIIRMIDTDMSLGSQTERVFARQIGVKVMNICVVQPAAPEALATINHHLAEDTARLIEFGATIFDTRNNHVRLVLAEEAA